MPIRPEERARYPKEWSLISLTVRALAEFRCQWCAAENGKPNPRTGAIVVLTVAHLDHQPENCDGHNLRALCQQCHNSYDAARRARRRRNRPLGMDDMVEIMEAPMPVDPKDAEGLIATLDAGLFYTAAGEASCHGDRSQAFIEAEKIEAEHRAAVEHADREQMS